MTPLFGVDDFEMHLDAERQKLFRNALNDLGQVFITTPQTECDWQESKRLAVHKGTIA
jgi:recombinational DNA repair ATPase RecF